MVWILIQLTSISFWRRPVLWLPCQRIKMNFPIVQRLSRPPIQTEETKVNLTWNLISLTQTRLKQITVQSVLIMTCTTMSWRTALNSETKSRNYLIRIRQERKDLYRNLLMLRKKSRLLCHVTTLAASQAQGNDGGTLLLPIVAPRRELKPASDLSWRTVPTETFGTNIFRPMKCVWHLRKLENYLFSLISFHFRYTANFACRVHWIFVSFTCNIFVCDWVEN